METPMHKAQLDRLAEMVGRMNGTTSKNEKLEILLDYSDDKFIENVLVWVYHPDRVLNVTSASIAKRAAKQPSHPNAKSFEDMFQLLTELNEQKLTGHAALDSCALFMSAYPEHELLLRLLIDRNLKIGIDSVSINKAYPGELIPQFNVALANKYDEKTIKKVNPEKDEWFISRKLDGCLSGDTLLQFENGEKHTISHIVNNKIQANIQCFNHKTKKIEYKPIVNWMKNIADITDREIQWYEIELENGVKLKLTGNHLVYLPKLQCYRRVDELSDTDFLLTV